MKELGIFKENQHHHLSIHIHLWNRCRHLKRRCGWHRNTKFWRTYQSMWTVAKLCIHCCVTKRDARYTGHDWTVKAATGGGEPWPVVKAKDKHLIGTLNSYHIRRRKESLFFLSQFWIIPPKPLLAKPNIVPENKTEMTRKSSFSFTKQTQKG